MPPVNPPLKNDGPACRVCGCTEHNACLIPIGLVHDAGCSWVKTHGVDSGPLCSACAGSAADFAEAVARCRGRALQTVRAIMESALTRYRKRKKRD